MIYYVKFACLFLRMNSSNLNTQENLIRNEAPFSESDSEFFQDIDKILYSFPDPINQPMQHEKRPQNVGIEDQNNNSNQEVSIDDKALINTLNDICSEISLLVYKLCKGLYDFKFIFTNYIPT